MVYFMQEKSNIIGKGRIKIGMSGRPFKRLRDLQRETRRKLFILGVVAFPPSQDEAYWHKRFAAYRIGRTEWFWPGKDLTEHLLEAYQANRAYDTYCETGISIPMDDYGPTIDQWWMQQEVWKWERFEARERGELASAPQAD